MKFIGIGEQVDDLQPFDPEEFAKALFMDDESFEELENETEAQTDNSEEDNRPATADIWDKIDAEAEAERQAELDGKSEEEIQREKQEALEKAKIEAEKEKQEQKKRAEERKEKAKSKYNWNTSQSETNTSDNDDDDWLKQWRNGEE